MVILICLLALREVLCGFEHFMDDCEQDWHKKYVGFGGLKPKITPPPKKKRVCVYSNILKILDDELPSQANL